MYWLLVDDIFIVKVDLNVEKPRSEESMRFDLANSRIQDLVYRRQIRAADKVEWA